MPEPSPSALSPARERLRRLMERYRATELAPRDDKKEKLPTVWAGEARVVSPEEAEMLREDERAHAEGRPPPAREYTVTAGEARLIEPPRTTHATPRATYNPNAAQDLARRLAQRSRGPR